MANNDDIIDLCDSFTLANHHALTNVLIELEDSIVLDTDTSIVDLSHSNYSTTTITLVQSNKPKRDKKYNPTKYLCDKQKANLKSRRSTKNETINDEAESRFGDCPICFDALGQNPLASTKCGHVYCMKCIEQYLLFDKRCPTCRQILKGKSAYHPLYLNK